MTSPQRGGTPPPNPLATVDHGADLHMRRLLVYDSNIGEIKHVELSEQELMALLEKAGLVVAALHAGREGLNELLPMYHWASDILEWEADVKAWSEEAGKDLRQGSPVADALLNRFTELEQARQTAEEGLALQAMASDEELRRLVSLNELAESGSDTERMLHDLISRYDEVRSKLELLYRKCAVVTSIGAKGGPRGWSVRRLELEELYLYLKEGLTSGESLEDVAQQLSLRIERISCDASRHGAEIVGLLLDIHLSEDELIALKRHIDMVVNDGRATGEEGKSQDGPAGDPHFATDISFVEAEASPQVGEWRSQRVKEIAAAMSTIETSLALEESKIEGASSKAADELDDEDASERRKWHEEQLAACRFGLDVLLQHEQRVCEERSAHGGDLSHLSPREERESREAAARAIISRYESDHKRLIEGLELDRVNQRKRIERRLQRGRAVNNEDIQLADQKFRSYAEASNATCLQDCLTSLAVVFNDSDANQLLPQIKDALSAGKMLHDEIARSLISDPAFAIDDREDPAYFQLPVSIVNEAFAKVAMESSSKGTVRVQAHRATSHDLLSRMRSVVVKSAWENVEDSAKREKLLQASNRIKKLESFDSIRKVSQTVQ